jgi:FtsP/CotA-like multicopper oxidase with cupredoxin domain
MRIINASSDTAFRVALGGHRFTVTHTDGFPVEPAEADALLIGRCVIATAANPRRSWSP